MMKLIWCLCDDGDGNFYNSILSLNGSTPKFSTG